MTTLHTLTRPTPAGALTTLVDGDTVVAAGFTDPAAMAERLGVEIPPPAPADHEVGKRIDAWLAGDLAALDGVAVDQDGTELQRTVWAALRRIPAGTTVSYGELAAEIGRPTAFRAVAGACARNRIAPFVPCHRVVRSDGALGGYAYGVDAKGWLLDHESGQDLQP